MKKKMLWYFKYVKMV